MHRSSCLVRLSQSRPRHLLWQWAGVLLVALLALYSCGAPPQNLSFTTMTSENAFTPRGIYWKEEPALLVIGSSQDLINPGLDIHFASGLSDPLRTLDYSHKFAVMVFQGRQGSGRHHVIVQTVTRTGSLVRIQAMFINPLPNEARIQALSSPYQLAIIAKDPAWESVNRFELVVDGTVVARSTQSSG
jgi:hypothetical protein